MKERLTEVFPSSTLGKKDFAEKTKHGEGATHRARLTHCRLCREQSLAKVPHVVLSLLTASFAESRNEDLGKASALGFAWR